MLLPLSLCTGCSLCLEHSSPDLCHHQIQNHTSLPFKSPGLFLCFFFFFKSSMMIITSKHIIYLPCFLVCCLSPMSEYTFYQGGGNLSVLLTGVFPKCQHMCLANSAQ